VLTRPHLARYGVTGEDVDELLALLAPLLPDVDVEVEIRDPDDAKVVGCAIAARADAIVTGDRDLLDDRELRGWLERRGVEVVTPPALLERIAAES
jgi:putative PIN family toxin of toxin-antitoxin system